MVLSLRRANSEIGKWIEDREKHSELLGGAADAIRDTASEKYLAQTLLDMSMDHSMKTGFKVAEEAIKELRKVAKMHKRYPQAASLAVLKSPDIPSILVETGFISNPHEEQLLKTAAHREKLAERYSDLFVVTIVIIRLMTRYLQRLRHKTNDIRFVKLR